MRGLDRRAVLALVAGAAAAGVSAAVASCGRGDRAGSPLPLPGGQTWSGGPVTPQPIPVTLNPSALPLGDTMPTGIVLDGKELVLDIWQPPPNVTLDHNWYDRISGVVSDTPPRPYRGGTFYGDGPMRELTQLAVGDGTLIEYGVVLAAAALVVVEDGGHSVQARFCRWSRDASVTVWWLRRTGDPVPEGVPVSCGQISPWPTDRYPRITATDADGKLLAHDWLRPGQAGPHCDG